MKLKPSKKAFIRKLAAKLRRLRHEEHFNQAIWGDRSACGTIACVAGHAVVLGGWKLDFATIGDSCTKGNRVMDTADAATDLLGIENLSFDLFYHDPTLAWPEPYATRWTNKEERHSRVAADLLMAIADGRVE